MRYVAAYLLASLGGNDSPSNKDLEKIIGSVGIECEADKLKTVIDQLKGKSLEQLIQEGQSKLASVPAGGAVAASGGGGGGAAPAEEKAEAKKEEKKEESEESDDDMGFGLFD